MQQQKFRARTPRNPSLSYSSSSNRPYTPARAGNQLSFRLFLFLMGICLAGGWLVKVAADAEAAVLESEHAVIMAEIIGPFAKGPKIDEARLNSEIGGLIADHPELEISVDYLDLTKNKHFHYGVDSSFGAASISKLVTAAYYLDQVDEGKRSLSDTIGGASAREQLRLLIEISDNTAWDLLDKNLGGSNLEAYAKSIGMQQFDHNTNRLTAADVTVLLEKLYRRTLLSQSSTDLLLGHLKKANYRQYIVAAVPNSSDIYHKVGYLTDRVHDSAIVDNGKHPYVVVIFTKAKAGGYNFVSGGNLIQSITESIQKSYDLP